MYKTVKPFRKTFYLKFRSPIFSINLYTFIVFIHSIYQGLDNLNLLSVLKYLYADIRFDLLNILPFYGKLVVRNCAFFSVDELNIIHRHCSKSFNDLYGKALGIFMF